MSSRGFLKRWMLVLAMCVGVGVYLAVRFLMPHLEGSYMGFARRSQPAFVGLMLFLQFNVTAPTDMHLHRWHAELLVVQALLFAGFAFLSTALDAGSAPRVLMECAMLCFICPTAAASGVITSRIGGSLPQIMAYLLLSDLLASLLLPVIVPLVHPSELAYIQRLLMIGKRVFGILVLPCALAWFIRYVLPGVQKWLARYTGWAFYIWGISLALAMSLATGAMLESGTPWWLAVLMGVVSLACCLLQFALGRRIARSHGRCEEITAGQALGQKNTGFLIWLGLNFMTPVTSVAGGLYAIWHNLVNSWELARYNSEGK